MTMYHKIWIEVDVKKEMALKIAKMKEILDALEACPCVENICKIQYKVPIQEEDQPPHTT